MFFDLEVSEGERFKFFTSSVDEDGKITFDDPAPDAGTVSVRLIDSDTLDEIRTKTRKKVTEHVLNPKTRAMERIIAFEQTPEQEKMERAMIWDHAITGWEGIKDKSRNDVPCTKENKVKLMGNPYFGRFINECLNRLSKSTISLKEAEEKN